MYVIQSKLVSLPNAKENWNSETLPMSRVKVDKVLKLKLKRATGRYIYRAISVA